MLIGRLTNSVGLLLPSGNQVIYTNAFEGCSADLLVTYRRSGLEADLVFRAAPPPPEDYPGLNADTARLQLWTEFFDTSDPEAEAVTTNRQDNLTDRTLKFGAMKMVRGRAFVLTNGVARGLTNNAAFRDRVGETPVYKIWEHQAGRVFLTEGLPYRRVRTQLEQLRASPGATNRMASADSILHRVSPTLPLPPVRLAQAAIQAPIQLARADLATQPGYVLDYVIVDSDSAITLTEGTYLVAGGVYFDTVNYESGVVVKFADGGSSGPGRLITGSFNGGGYGEPIVFTSQDDDSVGEVISGSTGNPGIAAGTGLVVGDGGLGYVSGGGKCSYLDAALSLSGDNSIYLSGWRFENCNAGICQAGAGELSVNLYDSQFSNCLACVYQDGGGSTVEWNPAYVTFNNCATILSGEAGTEDVNSFTTTVDSFAVGTDEVLFLDAVLNALLPAYSYLSAVDVSWNDNYPNYHCYWGNPVADYPDYGTSMGDVPASGRLQAPASTLGVAGQTAISLTFKYSGLIGWNGSYGISLDGDADGLPDAWERQYFGNLDATAADDPDGDWLTNWQEYTNGSNPSDRMVLAWGVNHGGQLAVPTSLLGAAAVAGGFDFSLVLHNDGTVTSWGSSTNVLAGTTDIRQLSAKWEQAVAVRSNGTVAVWGTTNGPVPVDLTNAIMAAAGDGFTLALRTDGTVTAWGTNNYGQCNVPTGLPAAKAVAAGWEHAVALLQDGTVRVWGNNGYVGWNVTNVPAGLSNVTTVAAGGGHTLALRADGTVVAWGAGWTNSGSLFNYGQAMVPTGLSNVVAVSAGGYHSTALQSDGSVVVWGDLADFPYTDAQGQIVAIGSGDNHALAIRTGRLTPLTLTQPTDQFAAPGATAQFTAAGIGLAGVHYQWQFNGVNLSGETNAQLTLSNVSSNDIGNYRALISTGAGSVMTTNATLTLLEAPTIDSVTPQPGSYTFTTWFPMSVSASANGTAQFPLQYQWFKDGAAIADATYTNYSVVPTNATPLWQTNPVDGEYSVKVWNAAGTNQAGTWVVHYEPSFADGSAVAWGADDDGESEYPLDLTNAIAIAAGEFHSVAVREDGSVTQWGYDWADVPADLTNAVAVAAGNEHSLAVRGDGTVTVWGRALNPAVSEPVPANLAGVKAVAAGWFHNVALLTNGTIQVWGDNTYGELNIPANLTNVTAVAAGLLHSLALRNDGTVVAWGWDSEGQANVPTGLSNVVAVAAGRMHSLAIKADGTVVAWGLNDHGQTNVPATLTNAMAIAGGTGHSVALREDGSIEAWGDNSAGQCDVPATLHTVKLIAAGGDHTLAAVFSPYLRYPGKAESLVDNMLHMLTSRTNASVSSAYFDLPPYDAGGDPEGPFNNTWGGTNLPILQTNFWLRDVTNIYLCSVAALGRTFTNMTNVNTAAYVCTPISPRHAITAGHVGSFFAPGQKMV
ncbi:MAG TPA: hypothetical protein VFV96_00565 [Verrucomicrobiae bacterium]|nr:hypothetical protein [Verrucomicrobiae bacterium]